MANLRISPLQWHPFTFIPGKRPNTLRAIVKSYGRWTQSLMDKSEPCSQSLFLVLQFVLACNERGEW